MPDVIIPGDVVVGEPVKASAFNTLKDAVSDINDNVSLLGNLGILGGSFETDNDTTGEPDAWTVTNTSGGTHALETTVIDHGRQSLKMVATATGGYVEALTDDFIPVGGGIETVFVIGAVRQSAAAEVSGEVLFYDETSPTPSLIATVPFMLETSLPAINTWYAIRGHADVPAAARYYRVRIKGGDGTAISDVYWDGMASAVTPFDWVWETTALGSGTTHTVPAVGYPKYALQVNAASVNVLGWDPANAIFTTVYSWRSSNTGSTAEVALDPIGQFQTSGATTPTIKAVK